MTENLGGGRVLGRRWVRGLAIQLGIGVHRRALGPEPMSD